jgi:hypothetical protein
VRDDAGTATDKKNQRRRREERVVLADAIIEWGRRGGGGSAREGKRKEAAAAEAAEEPPLAALSWIFLLGSRNWSYLEHWLFSCEEEAVLSGTNMWTWIVATWTTRMDAQCSIGWLGIKSTWIALLASLVHRFNI